ncbi:MAG: tetratricopeptide repeat protein [Proteobacteria bacterium]|nr:tetratricopeptide repeat protein [Pseudomonadota bacterium]
MSYREPRSRHLGKLLRSGAWAASALGVTILAACGAGEPPTWSNGVGELVYRECAQCHRPQGSAPFSMLRYAGASRRAEDMAEMVSARKMPPWLPSADGPHMDGERLLEEGEIELLVAWAASGAPEGDLERAPDPPTFTEGWTLGGPDLVVETQEGFPVPGGGPELFRNFVIPASVDRPRWVRAVELRPKNTKVVHHATVRVDETASSRLADARDSLPGCEDMFSRTEAGTPGGFFLGWTPGRIPTPYPPGMAWLLEPGTDFVVQLHLRPTGTPADAGVSVGLYFTDEPPENIPLIVRLGGQTMDIPAGDTDYEVIDEIQLPVSVTALGVYPHAHYRGKQMDGWAITPAGDSIPLLNIPKWDFNWQDAYQYSEAIPIPAQSTVHIRYLYDNSAGNPLNPFDPPQWCGYGPNSTDEMAEFWLQVMPDAPEDGIPLAQALAAKDVDDRVEGWMYRLDAEPDDPEAHFALGSHAQSIGDLDEAVDDYSRALSINPNYAQALHNMGLIREEQGEADAAVRLYERAVAALPDYPSAWNDLGRLRATSGDLSGALQALERAVSIDSVHTESRNNLGSVLRDLGRHAEAEVHYRAAIRIAPQFAPARFNRAVTLVSLARGEDALLELNAGLAIDGSNVGAALAVGWALATDGSPENRRPDLAADLAGQIRQIAGPHPAVLDVQAAAFAAGGRFIDAVSLIEQAIAEARLRDQGQRIPELTARRDLYRAQRTYVQPGR